MPEFQAQALLDEATARTGLGDFGEDTFVPALECYIDACRNDGYVPEDAWPTVAESILKILGNRLRFERELVEHPEILNEELTTPLFILGAPGRVGSTKLHRLLGPAQAIQTVPLWQVMNPVRPDHGAVNGDPRIAECDGFCGLIREHQPQLFAAIQPIATAPDEDPYMFDMTFKQIMFNASVHVPTYITWIYEQQWDDTYAYHRRMLQYLQWQNGTSGVPLLLKGPSHTPHLDMLHAHFPDAKVVHVHRDPVTCCASMGRVVELLQDLQPVHGTATLEDHSRLMADWTRHCLLENLRLRDAVPDLPVADFYYDDLIRDAVGVAEKIFEFWGVPLSDYDHRRIEDWEATNSQHKEGKFVYSVEDSGIDRAAFERSLQPYLDRFPDVRS
jgi:hypothetical protein